jgi:Phosphoglycerate mutase family.
MKILLVSVLVFVSVMAVAAAPQAQGDVVHALRKGGYVLFLRHTATNPEQADTDPLNLNNIKSQRQLMDEGRNQAKALGAALKQLKIPVGKILASKFYRARETAELLGLGEVEAVLDITEGGLVVSPRENQRRAVARRVLLATAPPEGKNTIIVSHRTNLQDAAAVVGAAPVDSRSALRLAESGGARR